MIVKLTFGTLIGEKYKHTHTHSKENNKNNNFWIVWHFSEPEIESSPMIIKIQYIHYHSPASIISFFSPPSLFLLFSSFFRVRVAFTLFSLSIVKRRSFFMYVLCILCAYVWIFLCIYGIFNDSFVQIEEFLG